MIKYLFLTALLSLIFGGVLSQEASIYLFTQCECQARQFPARALDLTVKQNVDVFQTDKVIGDGFDCPTDAVRGFTRVVGEATGVTGSFQANLFNNIGANIRTQWFMVFNIKLVPNGNTVETAQIIDMQLPLDNGADIITSQLTCSISFNDQRVILSCSIGADNLAGVVTISDHDNTVQMVIGQAKENLDEFNPVPTEGFFYCVSSTASACKRDIQALNNGFSGALSANLLNVADGGNVVLESLAVVQEVSTLLQFDFDFDDSVLDDMLAQVADELDQPALPVLQPNAELTIGEDAEQTTLNAGNLLANNGVTVDFSFNFDDIVKGVANGDQVTGVFNYEPNDDEFGTDTFELTYTPNAQNFPYECSLTVDIPIEIAQDFDAPTLNEAVTELQGFALVNTPLSFDVGNTVDNAEGFPNGVLEGAFVRLTSLPDEALGVLASGENCDVILAENTNIPMVGTKFSFCFNGAEGAIGGTTATFKYVALPTNGDVNKPSEEGTVNILGRNPVDAFVNLVNRSQTLDEEGSAQFVINTMVAIADGVDSNLIQAKVTVEQIPDPAQGVLTFAGAAVTNGQEFEGNNLEQNLQFTAAANFFNANGDAAGVDGIGESIDAECSGERLNGVCPATFSFRVTALEGGRELPGEAVDYALIVRAVDDFGLAFENPNEGVNIVLNTNDEENGNIIGKVNGLVFSSDNNNNIFNVRVQAEAINCVITVNANDAASGPDLRGNDDSQCTQTECSTLDLTGTPSEINDFFSKIEFRVPAVVNNPDAPSVNIRLSTGADLTQLALSGDPITFVVEEGQNLNNFFEEPLNIALVAGGSGLCLFIVIIVLVIKATAVSKVNGMKAVKKEPGTKIGFQARGKKNNDQSARKKRSFDEADEEDPVPAKAKAGKGEWEKHVDPETSEPFYHNPVTGETVWELPESI